MACGGGGGSGFSGIEVNVRQDPADFGRPLRGVSSHEGRSWLFDDRPRGHPPGSSLRSCLSRSARFHAPVPHQGLDGPDIHAGFQEMGREAVPQGSVLES